MLIKKGGATAPSDAGGAVVLAPGRMLPPEDLTVYGYDAWALSETRDGLVAVEALQAF